MIKVFTDAHKLKEEIQKQVDIKTALTNGCFDVLHEGHEKYLKDAKSRADVLILLLQSDEMIKQRKGAGRPIFNVNERINQLSDTEGYKNTVDYILVVNNAKDLHDSINEIRPDILIASKATENDETGPETMKELFEKKMEVVILEPKSTIHSSDIIREKRLRPMKNAIENEIKLK